jgi:hypothetical protein
MDICAFTSPDRNESKREIEHKKKGDKRHYKTCEMSALSFSVQPWRARLGRGYEDGVLRVRVRKASGEWCGRRQRSVNGRIQRGNSNSLPVVYDMLGLYILVSSNTHISRMQILVSAGSFAIPFILQVNLERL